jgi:hypothetical protein
MAVSRSPAALSGVAGKPPSVSDPQRYSPRSSGRGPDCSGLWRGRRSTRAGRTTSAASPPHAPELAALSFQCAAAPDVAGRTGAGTRGFSETAGKWKDALGRVSM